MKIINLNESPEEYKAKYEDATSQKEKCDAAEAALNEVLGGLGTKIRNNFGDYFLNLFITKFDWSELKKDNAFIQFLVKCNNFGQQELFTSEDLFSNAYNCYCHEVFLPEDLNDPKSVIFHQDLYKQPEKDIIYIKKIDDNLSTRYDIERILQLENIDSRILANRLTSLGIDYDKIVDMLANENYADLRKAVIYDRNGKVRSASTIKEIMDAFKKEGTKIYQKDKDGDTGAISIEQVANKVNRLDREDLVDFANGLNFETISALSNIIKGV